jgi:hypothetical protein
MRPMNSCHDASSSGSVSHADLMARTGVCSSAASAPNRSSCPLPAGPRSSGPSRSECPRRRSAGRWQGPSAIGLGHRDRAHRSRRRKVLRWRRANGPSGGPLAALGPTSPVDRAAPPEAWPEYRATTAPPALHPGGGSARTIVRPRPRQRPAKPLDTFSHRMAQARCLSGSPFEKKGLSSVERLQSR